MYIDTHADPMPAEPLELLRRLRARGYCGGVLLERDENFISKKSLEHELSSIEAVLADKSPYMDRLRPAAAPPKERSHAG